MSRELVKRISIDKNKNIKINSACSNVYPKIYTTWEYGGDIENLIADILGNNLDISASTTGKFIDYFTIAIDMVSKELFQNDLNKCYKAILKVAWYFPKYDPEDKKPTDNDIKTLKRIINIIKNLIDTNYQVDNVKYYLKSNSYYLSKKPNRNGTYQLSYIPKNKFTFTEYVLSKLVIPDLELINI